MRSVTILLSTTALVVGLTATQAFAQSAPAAANAPAQLEEITVTAERRSENLQKTPIAIAAFSGDELKKANVSRAEDLARLTPALSLVETGPNVNIKIRGVGTRISNVLQDPAIAFAVDGVFTSDPFGASGVYFDLERLEIVKGPQGTLYGRNATAGAINVITNKPVIGAYQGSADLSIGNYNAFKVNGMANVPLGDDAALRVAVQSVRHDGYLTSGYDDENEVAGRAQILWKPTQEVSLLLSTDYSNRNAKGGELVALNPLTLGYINAKNPWQDSPAGDYLNSADDDRCVGKTANVAFPYCINPNGHFKATAYRVSAQLDWDLGWANLVVLPAYRNQKNDVLYFPRQSYNQTGGVQNQYSFESRLSSENKSDKFQWLIGVFALDFRNNNNQLFVQNNRYPHPPYTFTQNPFPVRLGDKSYAAFTQETYSITDSLRITGGLRYTYERKTKNGYQDVVQPLATCAVTFSYGSTYDGTSCRYLEQGDAHWSSVQYRAGLDWDVTPSSLIYAYISKGEHAGGFSQGLPPNSYNPEELVAYTLGSKNRFLDNRLQANIEAFYWDYTNLQFTTSTTLPNPPITGSATYNAGKATIYGVDTDFSFLLTENDEFGLQISYNHSEINNARYPSASPPRSEVLNGVTYQSKCGYAGGFITCSGMPIYASPKWSGNASYQHTFPLENGANIQASIHEHFESSSYLDLDLLPDEYSKSYHMTSLALDYNAPDDKWTAGVYMDNVEDHAVRTQMQFGNLTSSPWVTLAPPRTYGVRVGAKF